MGMKIVAGRDFSSSRAATTRRRRSRAPPEERQAARLALAQRGVNVVLTREAARRLGFRDPAAAVGQDLKASLLPSGEPLVPVTVVGVVEDARFRSVRDPLQPIIYTMRRNGFGDIMVRFDGDPAAIRAQVEQVWKRNVPAGSVQGRVRRRHRARAI
jgi:putative ABC transport system permease protein